jgi:hypothetical protein
MSASGPEPKWEFAAGMSAVEGKPEIKPLRLAVSFRIASAENRKGPPFDSPQPMKICA